jgi:hypothetical protein
VTQFCIDISLMPCERVIYTESHNELAKGKARISEEVDPVTPATLYAGTYYGGVFVGTEQQDDNPDGGGGDSGGGT